MGQISTLETQKHETVTQNIKLMRIMIERDEEVDKLKAALQTAQTEKLRPGTCDSLDLGCSHTEDNLIITLEGRQQRALTIAEVKALSLQQLVSIWRIYIKHMAQSLHEGGEGGNPDQQGFTEAQRLANEACKLQIRVGLCKPALMRDFLACPLEDSAASDIDKSETWLEVARRLDLDKGQRRAICELRSMFLGKLQSLLLDRKGLHSAIADSLPHFINARHIAVQGGKADETLERIRESLKMEHMLVLEFMSTFYTTILTRLQLAKCFVQSYPWLPDTLAIATWVAVDAGDLAAIYMLSNSSPTACSDMLHDSASQTELDSLDPPPSAHRSGGSVVNREVDTAPSAAIRLSLHVSTSPPTSFKTEATHVSTSQLDSPKLRDVGGFGYGASQDHHAGASACLAKAQSVSGPLPRTSGSLHSVFSSEARGSIPWTSKHVSDLAAVISKATAPY
eukprot:jgi/Botrbrau1/741/Bobra.0181s0001.1